MTGVTPHGIRYPDGASKAKNLGPELQQMAEDIDTFIDDQIDASNPLFTDLAQNSVDAALTDLLPGAFDDRYLRHQLLNNPITDYEIVFTDQTGRVFGGIYPDGTVEYLKFENSQQPGPSDPTVEGETVSNRRRVALIGDSLTEGYPEGAGGVGDIWPDEDTIRHSLAALDPNATVYNAGHSGQTVDEGAIRIGALALTTQAAVVVPVTGTVPVTVQAGIGWRPSRTWAFHGHLGTIPGTLHRTGSATTELTFEADPGALTSATTVPAGTMFYGDVDQHQWDLVILGLGRNNVGYDVKGDAASVFEHVTAGLERIIEWLKPQRKRFLIWGTINSQAEVAGTAGHATVQNINDWCATTYPNNYIDVRSWLVNDAIYELGITPTANDLTAIASDTPPPSIMIDNVHWAKPVAPAVADLLALNLTRRDWMV